MKRRAERIFAETTSVVGAGRGSDNVKIDGRGGSLQVEAANDFSFIIVDTEHS